MEVRGVVVREDGRVKVRVLRIYWTRGEDWGDRQRLGDLSWEAGGEKGVEGLHG